jgi:hypothetical protein
MARHVPTVFADKVRQVATEVERVRELGSRAPNHSAEVAPGVRLVSARPGAVPVVFSLWTWDQDIAEICGDAAYPAAQGLLAIDGQQIAELSRRGVSVARSYLTRSETVPGLYYALLDHVSTEQLRLVLGRLVPSRAGGS